MAAVILAKLSATATDARKTISIYLHELRHLSLLGPPIFLISAIFLPGILIHFVGARWAPAEPFIHVILGMGVIVSVTFTHTVLFTVIERPQVNFFISSTVTALWIVGLFFLKNLEPIYSAVLWAGRMSLGVVLQLYFLQRFTTIRLRDYIERLLPMFASCCLIGLIAFLMHTVGWMNHATAPIQFSLGAGLCCIVALMILGFNSNLKQYIFLSSSKSDNQPK
jgi:hypothetical protein